MASENGRCYGGEKEPCPLHAKSPSRQGWWGLESPGRFWGTPLILGFNLWLFGGPARGGLVAAFLGDRVAGCGAAGGAFGASGSWPCGFGDMCRGADLPADVGKPSPYPPGGERPGGIGWFFPGAAQVGGVGPGEQQLGVGGHDKADPPAGLGGGADLGGGEPERAFQEPEGVFLVEPGEVRGSPEGVETSVVVIMARTGCPCRVRVLAGAG